MKDMLFSCILLNSDGFSPMWYFFYIILYSRYILQSNGGASIFIGNTSFYPHLNQHLECVFVIAFSFLFPLFNML
jgi:hypothetical protein